MLLFVSKSATADSTGSKSRVVHFSMNHFARFLVSMQRANIMGGFSFRKDATRQQFVIFLPGCPASAVVHEIERTWSFRFRDLGSLILPHLTSLALKSLYIATFDTLSS